MSANACPLPLFEYGEHQKPKGWKAAAPTRCQRLRELLADRAWHSHAEMTQVGGARFGARLLEMRRGQDGGTPWDVEVRSAEDDDRRTEYRLKGEAAPYVAPPACVRPKCQACGQEMPAEVES
jgi:hypothetical protein